MRTAPSLLLLSIVASGWIPFVAKDLLTNLYGPGPIVKLNNPPFAILNDGPVKPGGGLIVQWYGEKIEDCPGTGEAWVYLDNDPVRPSVSIRSGTLKRPLGALVTPFLYPMPAWIPQGAYDLHVRIQYDCGNGVQYQLLPPVPFVVQNEAG